MTPSTFGTPDVFIGQPPILLEIKAPAEAGGTNRQLEAYAAALAANRQSPKTQAEFGVRYKALVDRMGTVLLGQEDETVAYTEMLAEAKLLRSVTKPGTQGRQIMNETVAHFEWCLA